MTENLGKNRNVNERASPKVVDVAQSAEIVKPATSGSAAEGTPTKGKSQVRNVRVLLNKTSRGICFRHCST